MSSDIAGVRARVTVTAPVKGNNADSESTTAFKGMLVKKTVE